VYDEAVHLIAEHKAAGRDIVIVSSSGADVVEPIGAMLGADRVVATRLEIVDDGRGPDDTFELMRERVDALLTQALQLRAAVVHRGKATSARSS